MGDTGTYKLGRAEVMRQGGLATDDIRVLLVYDTYAPNFDTHKFVADVVADEVAGDGYARIGLTGATVSDDAVFDADDAAWASLDVGTPDAAIVYKFVTDDSDSILLYSLDLTPKRPTNTGPYRVKFNDLGIARFL